MADKGYDRKNGPYIYPRIPQNTQENPRNTQEYPRIPPYYPRIPSEDL
jgi:hypothetical protein